MTQRHDALIDTIRELRRDIADLRRQMAFLVQPGLAPKPTIHLQHSATFNVATGTVTTHPWDTTNLNTHPDVFSVSAGIVTVAQAGDYGFSFSAMTDGNASTVARYAWVDVNSSGGDDRYGFTATKGGSTQLSLMGADLVPGLVAGDTLRVVVFHAIGSTQAWGIASRPGLESFKVWKARHPAPA